MGVLVYRDGIARSSIMWFLYECGFLVGLVLYLPKALWRRRLPHRGWRMRLGRYPARVVESLRDRRSIWVHAVSVGEVLAVQPLLRALMQAVPQDPLVLSTITPGGFEVASKRASQQEVPVYFPLDLRWCVRRALATFRPRLLVLMESELWPVVIALTKARGIPIAVVNGRISPRAFRRYRLITPWLGGLLGRIDLFLMQSQADADRLIELGAPLDRIKIVGSLKWDASLGVRPSLEAIRETAIQLGLNGHEIIIVAGSTHRGEETVVLQAFQTLRARHPAARLILAPRHVERVAEVEGMIRHTGFSARRCSQRTADRPWDVGIVDTFGCLPQFYGLATVVFIGGSLVPHGGQNPLEAASLGKPLVFGPSMHNFSAISHQLLAHHAARQLTDREALTRVLGELLDNPTEAQAMGHRAQELTDRFRGAAQRTLEALAPLLQSSTS